MNERIRSFYSRKIGLALSGGGVRGSAHIGVLKALSEMGIQPVIIAGVSVGSIVGAGLATGLHWPELMAMARSVLWPRLLPLMFVDTAHFCAQSVAIRRGPLTVDSIQSIIDVLSMTPICTFIRTSPWLAMYRVQQQLNG